MSAYFTNLKGKTSSHDPSSLSQNLNFAMHLRNIDRFTMRKSETRKLKTQAKEDVRKNG